MTTPGQYRVRVTSQNGTSGEYFVSAGQFPISNIQSVTIDDGTAQRSRVRSITLTLNGTIVSAPASAFHLVRTEDGLVVPVVVSAITPLPGGQTQITLTFDGPSLEAGSLADGHYTLSIDGSQIIDSNGQMLDAAGTGVVGSSRTVAFLRFFGDTNGDGIVDANDYLAFRARLPQRRRDRPQLRLRLRRRRPIHHRRPASVHGQLPRARADLTP